MTTAKTNKAPRQDMRAIYGIMVFSLFYCALIYLLGWRLDRVELLPDQGASWYYWKLPVQTLGGRLSAWGFYLAHQLSMFALIYYGQTRLKKYGTTLRPFHYVALGINAFFILLHLLQSQIWYDGLAQDVSIWSSQWSVILLLVWVLLMENNRRGMFFGKKLPIKQEVIRVARKYHGYYFAWAAIYTFWYHPTISTTGHLIGFFYTLLLILQGSLMFTRAHTNKYWTFFLEFLVLAHGTVVAVMQANGMWPMFFFGFAGILIVTQIHGLGLSRLVRGVIIAAYFAFALFIYSDRGIANIHQITWIPITDYVVVMVLAGLFMLGLRISKFFIDRGQTKDLANS